MQTCVTQLSGYVYRLLKIRTGPFVIAPSPQNAQVQDTLPLEASILRLTCCVQCPFVVGLRLLGSAPRVLHGLAPEFRFGTVIRQVGKGGIQGRFMQLLERLGDGAM